MGKGLNVPEKGSYLVFVANYTFITHDGPGVLEIPKGTLAKVVDRRLEEINGTDEVDCKLLISLDFTGETRLFKFNYSIHQELVDILPENKATKLLYEQDQ
jgi:hypothetical protein